MQPEDIQRYCDMMVEVKGRTHLIKTFAASHDSVLPLPALVELFYLHLRKILETIAMGSLLANANAFGREHERLKKYWNPKDLLRDMEKLNRNFYPRPIIQKQSEKPGVFMDWLDRSDDFLTKDRFITLYDKCGGVLHTRNPFRADLDYPALALDAPTWCIRIVNLLNAHLVRPLSDSHVYLVQMGNDTQRPTCAVFAPASDQAPAERTANKSPLQTPTSGTPAASPPAEATADRGAPVAPASGAAGW